MGESSGNGRSDADALDEAHAALSHPSRHRLLTELLTTNTEETRTVRIPDDIVEETEDPERVYGEFYHRHLPRLEKAGFVDRVTEQRVAPGPKFDVIERVLDSVESDDSGK